MNERMEASQEFEDFLKQKNFARLTDVTKAINSFAEKDDITSKQAEEIISIYDVVLGGRLTEKMKQEFSADLVRCKKAFEAAMADPGHYGLVMEYEQLSNTIKLKQKVVEVAVKFKTDAIDQSQLSNNFFVKILSWISAISTVFSLLFFLAVALVILYLIFSSVF